MGATLLKTQERATSEPLAEAAPRPYRMVLPKKGRLAGLFNDLIRASGFAVARENERQDFGALADDGAALPGQSEALYMRPLDGLRVMAAGAADITVTGLDMLAEFNAAGGGLDDAVVTRLGLMKCGLYIAARNEENYTVPQDLAGKRIATSFPALTQRWLAENNVSNCPVIAYDGGIEDLVRLGIADVICDLVETGKTLAANGLRPQLEIMQSEIVLVSRANDENAARIADRLRAARAAQSMIPA